jgi:hypothetical protein
MRVMLSRYIQEAMKRARYKVLEDGTYFGQIGVSPEFGRMNELRTDVGKYCRKCWRSG